MTENHHDSRERSHCPVYRDSAMTMISLSWAWEQSIIFLVEAHYAYQGLV